MNNNALIVARTEHGLIAVNDKLPWKCEWDMAHFTTTTKQYDYMLMGRRTYQSLPGLLPDRGHIILSNARQFSVAQDIDVPVHVLNSKDAERVLDSKKSVIVIGGAMIYDRFIDWVDTVYETVMTEYKVGEVFPNDKITFWKRNLAEEFKPTDVKCFGNDCKIITWVRK